jgi:tol-pal system protein YbgF
MTWARLAAAILAILATGCATRGSVRHLRSELTTVRAELASARQAHEATAREAANTASEAKALDARVRELSAGLRESSQQLTQLRARLNDAEEGLARIRIDVAARTSTPASPPAPPPAPAAPPPPPAAAPVAPAPAAGPPERQAREAAPRPGAAETAYGTALATFRAREHGQAVLEFMDFIVKYPRHSLAPNAQYWIGEAYYVQHDYRQALTEFQKVLDVDAATGTGKTPDALLKIGLCYVNLHEPTRAQQVWQRVLRDHPDSDAAVRARALLRSRRTSAR